MDYSSYIKAIKKHDEQAFGAVYHETKHAVYAMILPIVKDRSLAEDVMQETYIKMLKSIDQYQKKYKFINWLLTIAKNTALDELRKRSHDSSVSPLDTDDLFIAKESSIETRLITEHYLSLIPDEEKQIVLLKVVGDLKHKEIAQLLGKPLGTITYLYNKAIKTMQRYERSERDD